MQENKNQSILSPRKNYTSVFHKLYKDADKRRSLINKNTDYTTQSHVRLSHEEIQFKKKLLGGDECNYGERIYYKGIKLKEENELKIKIKKQENEKKNNEVLTFKPLGAKGFISLGNKVCFS